MVLYSLYFDVTAGRGEIVVENVNNVGSFHSDYYEFDQTFSDKNIAKAILDKKNAKL